MAVQASCRRIFSVDVVLLDALGQAIDKELEVKYLPFGHTIFSLSLSDSNYSSYTKSLLALQVVASLIYADNGLPVEKTSDDEAPLLTTYDGIEFASCDRPSKIMHGRASFKLKISQV